MRVSTGLGGEEERFGNGLNVEGNGNLVGYLAGLAVPVGAEVDDIFAHKLKVGLNLLEEFFRPADHDGEGGFFGTDLASGNGGIKHSDTHIAEFFGEFFGGDGGYGAHIDDDGARFNAFSDTILTEEYRLYVRRIRHHDDGDFRFFSDFPAVSAGNGAFSGNLFYPGFDDIINVDGVACFQQVADHRLAHDAQSDKSQLCHYYPPSIQATLYFSKNPFIYRYEFIQSRPASVSPAGIYSQPIQPL